MNNVRCTKRSLPPWTDWKATSTGMFDSWLVHRQWIWHFGVISVPNRMANGDGMCGVSLDSERATKTTTTNITPQKTTTTPITKHARCERGNIHQTKHSTSRRPYTLFPSPAPQSPYCFIHSFNEIFNVTQDYER